MSIEDQALMKSAQHVQIDPERRAESVRKGIVVESNPWSRLPKADLLIPPEALEQCLLRHKVAGGQLLRKWPLLHLELHWRMGYPGNLGPPHGTGLMASWDVLVEKEDAGNPSGWLWLLVAIVFCDLFEITKQMTGLASYRHIAIAQAEQMPRSWRENGRAIADNVREWCDVSDTAPLLRRWCDQLGYETVLFFGPALTDRM